MLQLGLREQWEIGESIKASSGCLWFGTWAKYPEYIIITRKQIIKWLFGSLDMYGWLG